MKLTPSQLRFSLQRIMDAHSDSVSEGALQDLTDFVRIKIAEAKVPKAAPENPDADSSHHVVVRHQRPSHGVFEYRLSHHISRGTSRDEAIHLALCSARRKLWPDFEVVGFRVEKHSA